jgi:metal-responsive CopG/Arc/MetJ family transcriptional regulator
MTEVVSFKLERSLLVRIDGLAGNRSDFIRQAIEEKVQRAGHTNLSTWDALQATKGLELTIRATSEKVRRIDL